MSDESMIRNRAYELWEQAGRPQSDGARFWQRAEAELRYLRAVAHLPIPTAAQTADFAAHVLNARSWYKHVPRFEPAARLVMFLDPDAGMQLSITPGGEELRPRLTAEDCWHPSLLPTAEHRRRFGHWTYWVVQPASDDRPRVRDASGNWLPVPDEVCDRSGCAGSALLANRPAVARAFAAGRRWFAATRLDAPALAELTAREILEKLSAADLVAIRNPGGAVDGLASRLVSVAPADVPGVATEFLDASDTIDEIYTADTKIRALIEECLGLPPREPAPRPVATGQEYPFGTDPMTGWARMDESKWLASTSPNQMLQLVRGAEDGRKLRLFACAYCRSIEHLLTPAGRAAIMVAESFADGSATAGELADARAAAQSDVPEPWPRLEAPNNDDVMFGATTPAHDSAHAAAAAVAATHEDAYRAASDAIYHAGQGENMGDVPTSEVQLDRLLHDIYGNPFRPVAFDPAWRTTDVMLLAKGIYDDRAFDRMPILADALQDAGCEDEQVLVHCRGDASGSPHARGCWVIDRILGMA